MQKQDWKALISKLEKEIVTLHDEIKKREEIVKNLKSLQEISVWVFLSDEEDDHEHGQLDGNR